MLGMALVVADGGTQWMKKCVNTITVGKLLFSHNIISWFNDSTLYVCCIVINLKSKYVSHIQVQMVRMRIELLHLVLTGNLLSLFLCIAVYFL